MLQFEPSSDAAPETSVASGAISGGFSFDDLGRLFRFHRKLILGVTAAALAATVAFGMLATPRYLSTAQLLIDPRDLQVVKNEVKPTTSSSDAGIAVVETEALVISSESVLRRAITTLGLDKDEDFVGGWPSLRDVWNKAVTRFGSRPVAETPSDTPAMRALRTLQKRLVVERPERTYVVNVTVGTDDPDKSARVAEGVVNAYIDEQGEARKQAAQTAADTLSQQLDRLRDDLRVAEDKVETYNAAHNIVDNGGGLVNEQQLSQINTKLMTARAEVASEKARYDQITGAHGSLDALPEAVQSNTLRGLRERYAAAADKLAQVSAQLLPQHPEVITARQEEAKIEQLVKAEIARTAAAAKVDYERAVATETSLQDSLDTLKRQALDTDQALVEQRELKRDADSRRDVYEAALVRTRETRELEQINTANTRIITHAMPPKAKSWPPRLLLMLPVALVGGLILGFGLAFLKDGRVTRRRPAAQVQRLGYYA